MNKAEPMTASEPKALAALLFISGLQLVGSNDYTEAAIVPAFIADWLGRTTSSVAMGTAPKASSRPPLSRWCEALAKADGAQRQGRLTTEGAPAAIPA